MAASLPTLRTAPSTWWMETRWVASTPSPSTGTSASGCRCTATWPQTGAAGLWVASAPRAGFDVFLLPQMLIAWIVSFLGTQAVPRGTRRCCGPILPASWQNPSCSPNSPNGQHRSSNMTPETAAQWEQWQNHSLQPPYTLSPSQRSQAPSCQQSRASRRAGTRAGLILLASFHTPWGMAHAPVIIVTLGEMPLDLFDTFAVLLENKICEWSWADLLF